MARIRRNRKGFTLMEVLVSIAIIGVVFMPILTFFSNSSQTNVKVKNIQRANTVAQSVMEEFRSYATIQDMAETYWNDEGSGDTMFMTDSSYNKSGRPGVIVDSNGVFQEKDNYYFLKEGINFDGKDYVAQIHVSPGDYNTLNGVELPVISSLGSETTVVAREEEETLDKIREYTRLHFNKTGVNLNVDDIASKIRKTMMVEITDTVTVENADGSQSTEPVADGMVHVRVYNKYDLTTTIDGCENAQMGHDIFDGLMEESQLEGIYVFYNYDITKANTQIMQGMEVVVDLQQTYTNWKCNYTVYAVCQGIKEVDEDVFLTGTKMEDYINAKNPSIKLSATTNVNGFLLIQMLPEVVVEQE